MKHPEIRTIPLLAWLAWALLGAHAAVADGAAGEPEETRFSAHTSIRVSTLVDDNVHLEGNNGDTDIGATLFPRVELGLHSRSLHMGADLGIDLRGYSKSSSPNEAFLRLGGFAELGLLPGLTVRVSDAYAPTPVDLGKPLDHSANLVQTNRLAMSIRKWSEMPNDREVSLALQVSRHTSEGFTTDIGNGETIDDFHADFWEYAAIGEFHTPVTENMSGFLRANTRWRSFDDSEVSNFADISVLVGISTQWWESVDFEAAIGIGRLAFEDHGQTRFLGEATARYRISDGTTLRLNLYQRNTADIVGNEFTESTGRFDIERRFGERLEASLGLFITRLYDDSWNEGSNLFGGVEATMRYQTTRRTQLELMYRHWNNAGNYDSDNFRENMLSLSFTYRR
jgi:hypothetical protein